MTTGGALIEVSDLHKIYPPTVALAGLTFRVGPAQILGLLGPNGAGKTTTMRALAGIIPPTRGRLVVAGHDVVGDPVAAKRQLAYVPDDPRLFDALTVWEHLTFIAGAYQVPDYERRAERLLREFELIEHRDKLGRELSRGMRQKVAICCAYLHEPRAILVDEPLTGLDPRGIRTMKDSLRERAAGGAAIVVSSHLLALVEDLCTHLLILDRGRPLFSGDMADARTACAGAATDSSLEEVFFRVTEGAGTAAGQTRAG